MGIQQRTRPHLLGLMFYVYVLRSSGDQKLYIGYTNDLKRRLLEHKTKKNFSTAHRGKLSLVYYEAFFGKSDAIKREKQLKQFKSAYGQLKKRIDGSLHEIQKVGE